MIGQTISHYRILSKLGEGGMGIVYLAEDTLLGRRVAIKTLNVERGKPHYRQRFLREARAVSALTHPNIAGVHDYGETTEGQPFIVMELVQGQTLEDLLSRKELTLSRILEIIGDVAKALAEAHHRGIVHRDIKPSNVAINERGEVKVLDFGLAKNLNADSSTFESSNLESKDLRATQTREGVVIGTPLYLSPEQALGVNIDTRSDIFSLGSLLYESLAGCPAFPGTSAIAICAKVIRDAPLPPSQVNSGIPPELDRITLKALAKNPADRYQTVTELLADLRAAHVTLIDSGNATVPRREQKSAGLRTSVLTKLSVKLHQWRILLAVFLATLVIALLVVWGISARFRSTAYKPSLQAERWYQDGTNALRNGTYYKASKILEEAIKQDDKSALAHARLAEAWIELDYTDKAKDELIRTGELIPERSKLDPLEALRFQAITDTVKRNSARAAEGYKTIIQLIADSEKPHAYVDLGRAYENNDELEKAIESYLEATKLDSHYAAAFLRLGIAYSRQLDSPKAEVAFDEALRLFQIPNDIEGVTEVLYQRGLHFNKLDKLSQAHHQLQQALDIGQTSISKPQRIKLLLQLSSVIYSEGNPSRAQQLAQEATSVAQEERLENLTTNGLIDIGYAFFWQGKFSEAEGYFKQALQIAQVNKGLRGEARAQLSLGSLHVQAGDGRVAQPYIYSALTFYQQGHYRKETAQALLLLGRADELQGDYDAAIKAYEQGIQIAEQIGDLSQVAYTHVYLGSLLSYQEKYSKALAHFDESYRIDSLLKAQPRIGYDLMNRGNVLWQLGQYDKALDVFNEASSIAHQSDSPNNHLLAWILVFKTQMALSDRKFDDAISKGKEAKALAGTQYKDIATQAMMTLGLAQALSGMRSAGVRSCQAAIDLAKSIGSPRLISGGQLALSEALLESGNAQDALKTALTAQESFARSEQHHSEWRAWLVAALASRQLGNHTAARGYAAHADDLFSKMRQDWDTETYNSYLRRRDIQYYRRQLGEILANNE